MPSQAEDGLDGFHPSAFIRPPVVALGETQQIPIFRSKPLMNVGGEK